MTQQQHCTVFYIRELDCANEMRMIERKLHPLPGISDLRANFLEHALMVYHDDTISASSIKKAILDTGFRPVIKEEEEAEPQWWPQHVRGVLTIIAGVFLAIGGAFQILGVYEVATNVLLLLALVTAGYHIARNGVRGALRLNLDMHFLMLVAAIGAVAVNEIAEGASVMFLFSVAQWLESRTIGRAREAIAKLLDLSPREAVILRGAAEERLPVEDVAAGETILIRPGERVPLDGIVTEGSSFVDESPVTGESMPVEKEIGSGVFAGTINQHGSLIIRSTRLYSDTTLSKIIHMVEEAQSRRAPSQRFVEKFAAIYTPSVIVFAALLALVPPLFGYPFSESFYRALVLLVIACPCALVISTPVTVVCALARSARSGVLIKGGVHLENIGKIDTVIFDKTGTLTQGKPVVVEVLPLDIRQESEVLRIAAGIEKHSEHHLAKAVTEKARVEGVTPADISNFISIPGKGARAEIDGTVYYAGSTRIFNEIGADTDHLREMLQEREQRGNAVVLIGTQQQIFGALVISDVIRPEAASAIRQLRQSGVREFAMLTGDNEGTANAIAQQLGIERYMANLLPEDKVREVEKLLQDGRLAAMVGDGVNDAPALAASTVGIAMGTAGTDAAIETADIALMADDLEKLPYAVDLGAKTLSIIRQNITLALAVKLVFIILTVFDAATLWAAVAADMGASLLVIFNGMRLLAFKQNSDKPTES